MAARKTQPAQTRKWQSSIVYRLNMGESLATRLHRIIDKPDGWEVQLVSSGGGNGWFAEARNTRLSKDYSGKRDRNALGALRELEKVLKSWDIDIHIL